MGPSARRAPAMKLVLRAKCWRVRRGGVFKDAGGLRFIIEDGWLRAEPL
jgi:hypothetical protein